MTKILVVEDDNSLREIYGMRIAAEGYTVIAAEDGEAGLAQAVAQMPDLIVSDAMMPKISGFEMLDLLKGNEKTRNIKIIMMTALSAEQQRERGEKLGADRYLVKSQVGIEDLIATIHSVLGDQQPQQYQQIQQQAPVANLAPAPARVSPTYNPQTQPINQPNNQPSARPAVPYQAQPVAAPTQISQPYTNTNNQQPSQVQNQVAQAQFNPSLAARSLPDNPIRVPAVATTQNFTATYGQTAQQPIIPNNIPTLPRPVPQNYPQETISSSTNAPTAFPSIPAPTQNINQNFVGGFPSAVNSASGAPLDNPAVNNNASPAGNDQQATASDENPSAAFVSSHSSFSQTITPPSNAESLSPMINIDELLGNEEAKDLGINSAQTQQFPPANANNTFQ